MYLEIEWFSLDVRQVQSLLYEEVGNCKLNHVLTSESSVESYAS